MKRRGPLNGSGPRSEAKSRVARKRSHTRSDSGRASPKPHSPKSLSDPTEPETLLTSPLPAIVLRARGRSRFDVLLFGQTQIVTSSLQPICDAARVLHRLGYSDERRLTVWHEGADDHAITSSVGFLRSRRVREERGMPRYVAWEPRPRRVGAKNGRKKFKALSRRAEKKDASTTTPGAVKRHSPGSAPSAEERP